MCVCIHVDVCVCVYVYIYIYIYYSVCLWFIVRSWLTWWWRLGSSRGCSWQAWRPRKADGIVSVWVWSPKNQENQWYKFQSELKSRTRPASQFEEAQAERANSLLPASCCLQTLQGLDEAFPNCRRQSICFPQSTDSNVNLTQKHPPRHILTDTPRILLNWISGHTVVQ